ncbi:hypothetical protein AB0F11_10320 [Streptomyces sp. NPDC032472]|uniref:hypothetical protein n=1 Tax=Streptomyces sp. NPDC032472 TaxID=3155018 RepID=UPI00340F1B22
MFEPMGEAGGGLLPDRGRARNTVNALLLAAGIGGLVFGGWSLYDTYETGQEREASRTLITRTCHGLVRDPGAVLRLGGGADRLEAVPGPETCAFDEVPRGGTRGERHFALSVRALPVGAPDNVVERHPDDPFASSAKPDGDLTARTVAPLRQPIGDGALGGYGGRDVVITAACAKPVPATGATAVRARAAAGPGEPLKAADRLALAAIARTAALAHAAEVGCETRLPELPDALPVPETRLGAVDGRTDACAWYGAHLRTAERGPLPDRALGTPPAAAAREEVCLLAVGPEEVRRIYAQRPEREWEYVRLQEVLTHRPWWIATHTYLGEDAGSLGIRAGGLPEPVVTGMAGTKGELTYATATCHGRPAVFTMHVPFEYDFHVVRDRRAEVFRAYVEDSARRHDCTGVTLPQ